MTRAERMQSNPRPTRASRSTQPLPMGSPIQGSILSVCREMTPGACDISSARTRSNSSPFCRECVAKAPMILPGLTPQLVLAWTRSRLCATRLTHCSAYFCQSPISLPIITSRMAWCNSSVWSASFYNQTSFSPPRTCKQVRRQYRASSEPAPRTGLTTPR